MYRIVVHTLQACHQKLPISGVQMCACLANYADDSRKNHIPSRENFHTSAICDAQKKKKQKAGSSKKPKIDKKDFPATAEELIDLEEVENKFMSFITGLQQDYAERLMLRTNQSSFTNLKIPITDSETVPLQYLGQVNMKGPSTIMVNLVFSPQYVTVVRDVLLKSPMNVNPRIDGSTIFIEIPKITMEQRERMAKSAKELCVNAKDKIRNEYSSQTKILNAGKSVFSFDSIKRIEKDLNEIREKVNKKAEEIMKQKQNELLGKS